ncbi:MULTISPECIES: GIY-YIG nuclease family protein [Terriglobus]|nr:GIY-YIG nuclease family protein [Terriglobus roseus]
MNAVEIEAAVTDLAAEQFNALEFPFQFLAAFDKKETTLKRLRKGDSNKSDVVGGVLLQRSLQRALYEPERQGRRLTQGSMGPLFGGTLEDGDIPSGTIYVLRSLSTKPQIAAMRDVLFKIGVTGGRVEDRIGNAERDPTYLLAPVEIVATWKLANIKQFKFEQTIHRILASAQLQLHVPDRFGIPVEPREWFVVPLPVINEIMERIQDESITEFVYDPSAGGLRRLTSAHA